MTSKNRTRSFLKNYCSGDGSCECIQLDQRVLQKLAFNAESPFHNINRSRAFTPVLDHCVSESSRRPRCRKTTELSFLQKTTSSSGREVLWSDPLHSPLSKTGSVRSSRGGSRTWSVLRDLRRTRNAITNWKLVLPIHASSHPRDIASTLLQSLVTGLNWN